MESPEFYTFMDEHDDDVIRFTTHTACSRALGVVLGKLPDLFNPQTNFPLLTWPSRSPSPDYRTMQDLEEDEFDGGSSEP